MALTAVLDGEELIQAMQWSEEQTAQIIARNSFEEFGQEPDPENDPADVPPVCASWKKVFPTVTPEEFARDSRLALREESEARVEAALERVAAEVGHTHPFDRAHFLLEPRSQGSFRVACYVVDVSNACKYALRNQPKLWHLYRLLFEQGEHVGIPAHILDRNPLVIELKDRCGRELRKRRLHCFTSYLAMEPRRHHREGLDQCSKRYRRSSQCA